MPSLTGASSRYRGNHFGIQEQQPTSVAVETNGNRGRAAANRGAMQTQFWLEQSCHLGITRCLLAAGVSPFTSPESAGMARLNAEVFA